MLSPSDKNISTMILHEPAGCARVIIGDTCNLSRGRGVKWSHNCIYNKIFKRPARDACLCMGELPAPPAPHFVFLITL